MTQFVYGASGTTLALGIGMMAGEETPFIAFVRSDALLKGPALVSGSDEAGEAIQNIEDRGGIIVWFENPDAADRILSFMSDLFGAAAISHWGHKQEAISKC